MAASSPFRAICVTPLSCDCSVGSRKATLIAGRLSGAASGAECSVRGSAGLEVRDAKQDEAARAVTDKIQAIKGWFTMQSNMSISSDGLDSPDQESRTLFQDNVIMQQAALQEQSFPKSTLYIVGLPIGNAADITLRALWILTAADAIACEDTRETRKLLDRYAIHTPTLSLHEHNERQAAAKLCERLALGQRIALVTDAGTPAVSDPGARAVQTVREAGFGVVPVPGASAVVTALSASGLDSYRFTFVGFVPPVAKARRAALAQYAARDEAFVVYEAPHRIRELLTDLAAALAPGRRVVVAREVTKRFETFTPLQAGALAAWALEHEPKGEYAVLVDQQISEQTQMDEATRSWARALADELPLSRAAAVVAKVAGLRRDAVYQEMLAWKEPAV